MFSYAMQQKLQQQEQDQNRQKQKYLNYFKRKNEQTDQMVKNHNKRIVEFMNEMSLKPLEPAPTSAPYCHRPEDPSKFIGPAKMTYNHYQDKAKQEQADREQALVPPGESIYEDKPFQFRQRNKKAEIHADMVFSSNNLDSFVQKMKGQPKKYQERSIGEDKSTTLDLTDRSARKNAYAKNYMPDLNERFYFKSVANISVARTYLPRILEKHSMSQPNNKDAAEGLHLETPQVADMSRQVLEKCGLKAQRKNNRKTPKETTHNTEDAWMFSSERELDDSFNAIMNQL